MTTKLTDDQIAAAAIKTVLDTLPYDRHFMEQLTYADLPVMLADGSIYGKAKDNAAVMEKYQSNWAGLVVKDIGGELFYWFIYRCQRFNERAMSCLGRQPSICSAIIAATHHVQADLKHWNSFKKA